MQCTQDAKKLLGQKSAQRVLQRGFEVIMMYLRCRRSCCFRGHAHFINIFVKSEHFTKSFLLGGRVFFSNKKDR